MFAGFINGHFFKRFPRKQQAVLGQLSLRQLRTTFQVLFPKQLFQKVPQLAILVPRAQVVMGKDRVHPRPMKSGTMVIGAHINQVVVVTKVVIRVSLKSILNRKKNFSLASNQRMQHGEMIFLLLREENMPGLGILSNLHPEVNPISI